MIDTDTCETLWLPPCPKCSWVAMWRRPAFDQLEAPGFYLARHTSARYGQNYYMMRGCKHATDIGIDLGPSRNRLKLAVAWRKRVAELNTEMNAANRFNEVQRTEINRRLSHPTVRAEEQPVT